MSKHRIEGWFLGELGATRVTGLICLKGGVQGKLAVQEDEKGHWFCQGLLAVIVTSGGEVWVMNKSEFDDYVLNKSMLDEVCPNRGMPGGVSTISTLCQTVLLGQFLARSLKPSTKF